MKTLEEIKKGLDSLSSEITIEKAFRSGEISEDLFEKAKSKAFQNKHPGSSWKTINGAKVLIGSGGEVIAGAGGALNKEKKESSTSKEKNQISEKDFLSKPNSHYGGGTNEAGVKFIKDNLENRIESGEFTRKELLSNLKKDVSNASGLDETKERIAAIVTAQMEAEAPAKEKEEKDRAKNQADRKTALKDAELTDKEKAFVKDNKQAIKDKVKEMTGQSTTEMVENDEVEKLTVARSEAVRSLMKKPDKVKEKIDAVQKQVDGMKDKKETPKKTRQPSKAKANKVLKEISEMTKLTKKLNSSPSTFGSYEVSHDTVSQMAEVASKIDRKLLSEKTNDKIDSLMSDIDTFTNRSHWNGYRKKGENKGFESKLKNASTLSGKLKFLTRELKNSQTNDHHDDKHGELSLDDDTMAEFKSLLIEASKEYGNNKATDVMNYKLF